ncbi:hypothetical protein B0H11DRAFT_1914978 [Mycena galericulata]|nr:hypothetical protein B0H11DRAFT_1914978 [Mycena galericulata]
MDDLGLPSFFAQDNHSTKISPENSTDDFSSESSDSDASLSTTPRPLEPTSPVPYRLERNPRIWGQSSPTCETSCNLPIQNRPVAGEWRLEAQPKPSDSTVILPPSFLAQPKQKNLLTAALIRIQSDSHPNQLSKVLELKERITSLEKEIPQDDNSQGATAETHSLLEVRKGEHDRANARKQAIETELAETLEINMGLEQDLHKLSLETEKAASARRNVEMKLFSVQNSLLQVTEALKQERSKMLDLFQTRLNEHVQAECKLLEERKIRTESMESQIETRAQDDLKLQIEKYDRDIHDEAKSKLENKGKELDLKINNWAAQANTLQTQLRGDKADMRRLMEGGVPSNIKVPQVTSVGSPPPSQSYSRRGHVTHPSTHAHGSDLPPGPLHSSDFHSRQGTIHSPPYRKSQADYTPKNHGYVPYLVSDRERSEHHGRLQQGSNGHTLPHSSPAALRVPPTALGAISSGSAPRIAEPVSVAVASTPQMKSREFLVLRKEQRRDPSLNPVKKAVRVLMQNLLVIKSDRLIGEAVHNGYFTTLEESLAYADHATDAVQPTLKPFCPCWDDIKGAWNLALEDLFYERFKHDHPELIGGGSNEEYIRKHFRQRLETLRGAIMVQVRELDEPERREETILKSRRRERRRTLFNRRKTWTELNIQTIIQSDGQDTILLLFEMVKLLGTDGMSSDESAEDRNKRPMCTVVGKNWRNPDLIRLLKWIDLHRPKHTVYGGRAPGNPPHRRIRLPYGKAPTSLRRPIANLPINFYDPVWYHGLSKGQKLRLNATEPQSLPLYILTWPTNNQLPKDEDDHDDY